MAGRSRSSWAFDMHHIVPSALYNDIDIRRALELAGYSLQSDGNKIALFWNSETAALVRTQIIAGNSFFCDAGFGGSAHPLNG